MSRKKPTTTPAPELTLTVRDVRLHDLPRIAAIDLAASAGLRCPWATDDIQAALSEPGLIVRLAEAGPEPVGYVAYEIAPGGLIVVDIAVVPSWRRRGVATALLRNILTGASATKTGRARAMVPDSSDYLPAHCAFRAAGFHAAKVEHEDIVFAWKRPAPIVAGT